MWNVKSLKWSLVATHTIGVMYTVQLYQQLHESSTLIDCIVLDVARLA